MSGACNAYSAATSRCRQPSLWRSQAFYGIVTSDVTLPIFVYPGKFVKLSSVQGRSLNFHPLDLHPSKDVRPRTFIHWTSIQRSLDYCPVSCHPVVLRHAILPFCLTSVRHRSFIATHRILQTVRCVRTL